LPVEALDERGSQGWMIEGEFAEGGEGSADPSDAAVDYATTLVKGVQEHQAEIDALISRYADRWTIDRMPVIDRNILRLALFELLWGEDVPVAVAVNEAIEIAKSLSTEDSGRFINGILGRIADQGSEL
jgi:transcription antitermination factor NusB